jgi:hypothetical protein
MSDETWGAICDSLKTHPTLQVLGLQSTRTLAPAVLTSRVQALVDMLKGNMSIHTIHEDDRYRVHGLFQGSVIPYLEMNRLRPRVRAIQKTRPTPYRAKVLGRALLAVRTDPNRFWMLLSGNLEVAFPTITATMTAATNLPTSSAAAVTAIAAITFTTAARAASTTGVSATANVAPSTARQKRKARP